MREQLLEILAEPGTLAGLDLEVTRHEGKSIEEGVLTSKQTGKRYSIVRGIPRFVEVDPYAENFGKQWNAFRKLQLDSENGASYSTKRFDDETGWYEDQLKGKWVLDAGCGAGRFSEVAAARQANLISMDLSSAVEATARTLSRFSNVDVIQGSILEPPFRQGIFDYVYCIGVIQHTPDPPGAIRALLRHLKEGGEFTFTIYGRRPWTKLNGKYLLRPITARMSHDTLLSGIERAMPVLFPITETLFKMPILGSIARFALPVANYTERQDLTRDQRYSEAVLDTFDMLAPRYDSPMTWQETEVALRGGGATKWAFRSRVPVVVNGTR
jgi:SAM-dependent methyltransferase